MKKYFVLFLVQLSFVAANSQVKGTLKAGTTPNSVIVAIKSSTTLTGTKMSSFQFAIGIPSTISPQPTAAITSTDPLVSYPAPLISSETQDGVTYTVYTYSGDGAQSGTGIDYIADQEYNYAQVTFSYPGLSLNVNDTRLMQLPNGGSNFNVNFYIADKGSDVTDQNAQFYSTLVPNFNNDGNGYSGSSWAKFGGLVLPVKFINFTATKNNYTALLNWSVENENANTDRYEVEQSITGIEFTKIGTLNPLNNGRASNAYSFTQSNLASVRNSGVIYFRIKQIDKDGQSVYTLVRSIRLDGKSFSASAVPNPVKDITKVTVDLVNDEVISIVVTDAVGKQVRNIQVQGVKGPNFRDINLGSLSAGSYMIKVQAGSEVKILPVVKTN